MIPLWSYLVGRSLLVGEVGAVVVPVSSVLRLRLSQAVVLVVAVLLVPVVVRLAVAAQQLLEGQPLAPEAA